MNSNKSSGAFALGRLVASVSAALLLIASAPALATIVSGTVTSPGSAFVNLTVPLTGSTPFNTVGADNFNSPNLFGFNENQNILLTTALSMNVGGTVAAGTQVASHYIFFDPVSGSVVGSVNFDADVLGIITSSGLLLASDGLANTGVTYLNPGLRGLESGDLATISGLKQISVSFNASTPGDYIRVITAFSPGAVPEPASLALVGLGFAAAAFARRRKT